jgi:predicted ABC-type ATPase
VQHEKSKRIIVIAGPNGAGKTTFAEEFLPKEANCPYFINADLIAAGLSPFAPDKLSIKAGKIMLAQIHEYTRRGESFGFETTLAGRGYAKLIVDWQRAGYLIKLFFLWLPTPELAIERVRQRVNAGGHNVPEQTIRRRFAAGWTNFQSLYKPLVDQWSLYDNSGQLPKLIEEYKNP